MGKRHILYFILVANKKYLTFTYLKNYLIKINNDILKIFSDECNDLCLKQGKYIFNLFVDFQETFEIMLYIKHIK